MKENLILVWETFIDNWNECNYLGKSFQILLSPIWILFAFVITPLEYFADKLMNIVLAIQRECTKDEFK